MFQTVARGLHGTRHGGHRHWPVSDGWPVTVMRNADWQPCGTRVCDLGGAQGPVLMHPALGPEADGVQWTRQAMSTCPGCCRGSWGARLSQVRVVFVSGRAVVIGRRWPPLSRRGRPSQHRHERRHTALRSASNQPRRSHRSHQNQPRRLPCGCGSRRAGMRGSRGGVETRGLWLRRPPPPCRWQ